MFKVFQNVFTYIVNFLVLCVVFALLLSFALHTIDIQHSHGGQYAQKEHQQPYSGASDIDQYAHSGEKKLFLLVLVSFLALGISIRNQRCMLRCILYFLQQCIRCVTYIHQITTFRFYIKKALLFYAYIRNSLYQRIVIF